MLLYYIAVRLRPMNTCDVCVCVCFFLYTCTITFVFIYVPVQRHRALDFRKTREVHETNTSDMFAHEQVDVRRADGHRRRLGQLERE